MLGTLGPPSILPTDEGEVRLPHLTEIFDFPAKWMGRAPPKRPSDQLCASSSPTRRLLPTGVGRGTVCDEWSTDSGKPCSS